MGTVVNVKSKRTTRLKTETREVSQPMLTGKDYVKIMARIDELIEIPDSKLTRKQASELHSLATAAQRYEKSIYTIKPPTTFDGILEMKMFELNMNQGEMAKKLNVGSAKFSLILSGKQKPDIALLKAVQEKLGVDGNYLLSVL